MADETTETTTHSEPGEAWKPWLDRLAASRQRRDDRIGEWQENIERGTPGIVLSGIVKDCQQVGERYEVRVELPSRDKRELLLITATSCQAGQKLFVAGRFVMSARDMVSGYTGDATMAIDARVVKVAE